MNEELRTQETERADAGAGDKTQGREAVTQSAPEDDAGFYADPLPDDELGQADAEPPERFVDDEYYDAPSLFAGTKEGGPLDGLSPHEVGKKGEELARSYLEERGYQILECNLTNGGGECDIVCSIEDGEVILVEVKTRLNPNDRYNSIPELAVNLGKMKRYRQIGLWYMLDHPEAERIRFDIIAINIVTDHRAHLRHLVGAFGLDS